MCRATLVIGLLLFNIILEQYPVRGAQSLNDFFPFGLQVGDTKMAPNDDESYGPIPLPYIFPYFDNNHQQIYQANNGLFSFLAGISTFNPISFPLADDQRLITPFWSDIDTRGQTNDSSANSVYHHVYTTNTSNSSNITTTVLDKAAAFVRQYFPSETAFVPLMVITGTWYRVGYFSFGLDRLNTFQMVLTTDQSRSFAFFLYNDLQWASQHAFGPYAQAGFNAGDGIVAKMLKYSRSSNITQLVNESNVNVPGLFAFRIDTTDIEAGGCGEHESLSHTPTRGRQIGGTTINLYGPCFDVNTTEVLCRFGNFGTVSGLVVNQFRIICVSPLVPYPGDVELAVSFDGGVTFNTSGIFTYMITTEDILNSEEIVLRQNGNPTKVVSWNGTIEIEWKFSNTLLARLPSDAFIDIIYEKLKPDEEQTRRRRQVSNSDVNIKIDTTTVLSSNIRPQAGLQTLQMNLGDNPLGQSSTVPVAGLAMAVFRVGAFVARRDVRVALAILAVVGITKLGAGSACDAWSDSQPDPSTWNEDLPPCPNTYRQAEVARADYIPDDACRVGGSVPILGNCWFHQGRPEFNEDNAGACFRSIKFNAHGAGGQCCYNDAGQIITRGTGAGSDDRYHSDKTFWKHQLHDVLPFIACCKIQSDPERCNKYLRNRPSRPGSDTRGQFGGAWGDPHFFTFDGTSYTFNGYGEYTYLVVPSQPSIAFDTSIPLRFESQIRTTPLTTGQNDVTVIKAFAARVGSLKISVTVSRRNQLLVHLNDEELRFESNADAIAALNIITLRFEDFSIAKNLANNQLTLSWAIGVNVQITPVSVDSISTLVLNVAAAISGELEGNWTLGLIGSYDGNPTNDLRDSFGTVIGTVDTLSSEEIHERFGMTWAIDPTRSLFYYESNDNAYFYSSQNMNYRPSFQEPTAGSLESTVRETCGIPMNSNNQSQWSPVQRTCYYDISVTRDVAFGRTSRQTAEDQIQQREAIRNPPRFNSALSLTQSVRIGQQVTLSFQATSEFTSNIAYSLLHGPNEASFNEVTGQFQWTVPDDARPNSRIPVQVSAQDAVYNLPSTYEVVLEIQQETTTTAATTSTISLPGGD